jgi:hypothetical protein
LNGPAVIGVVLVVAALLVAAFVVAEGEWERYVEWRDLHLPIWEREQARRALKSPRPLP